MTARTRELLIVTAERLFAEQGLAVSLRQINGAARQKNGSALHYHFGSRAGLIEAIFDLRMAPINAHRQHMIDAHPALNDLNCVDISRTLVAPLADGLCSAKVTYYARFLAQIQLAPDKVPQSAWSLHYGSIRRCVELFRDLRTDLSREMANLRFRLATTTMIMHLADVERERATAPTKINRGAIAVRTEDLIQALAGLLMAPANKSRPD